MGIIIKTIKYSLPIGATYYTVQLGLWQPGVGSPVAEKRLACQKRMVDEQIKEINQLIGSYISVPHYEMQIPDLRSNWNCWVKLSAQSLTKFDFVKTSDNVIKKITALMESNETRNYVDHLNRYEIILFIQKIMDFNRQDIDEISSRANRYLNTKEKSSLPGSFRGTNTTVSTVLDHKDVIKLEPSIWSYSYEKNEELVDIECSGNK